MVLTQKKINDAILKAKCCLASKTIKYFNQLSYGKDDMNLFKCINVLDIAIETLCKFEIVGSTSECPCTIEGTFLIEGLNQLIQFNNDGTGYVNGQAFIWYIDNSVVHVIFPNQQCYQTSGDGIPELGNECSIYIWENFLIEIYIQTDGNPLSRNLIYDAGFDEIHNTEELIADFNANNTVGAQIELSCIEECCYYVFTNLPTNLGNELVFIYGPHLLGTNPLESQDCEKNYTFNYTCDENGNLILSNFNDFLTYITSLNITSPPFEGAETLNLINQEECTPETIEQTCLSNKQIGDIINYINKTCTDC